MLNTLNAFVGALGATSLIERIDQADGHAGCARCTTSVPRDRDVARRGGRGGSAAPRLLAVI
jgi:hypothetical protein